MSAPPESDRFPVELGLPFVPSLLYIAGGALAVAGLALWPTHTGAALLATSLGASEAGGAVARRWGVGSRWGAELDWSVSIAVAAATAWCTLGTRAPIAVMVLSCWEAVARYRGWNVSGRAAVTIAALTAHFA